ncbi:YehR family protein [Listeria booriae]|nr:YehR family protein [Listeria booriae]
MKKLLSLVGILLMALLVTACGNDKAASDEKMEKDTYVADLQGAKLEATFSHVGDNVRKVDQKMVYPLDYLGLEEGVKVDDATKKQLEEQVTSQYKGYKMVKGHRLKRNLRMMAWNSICLLIYTKQIKMRLVLY